MRPAELLSFLPLVAATLSIVALVVGILRSRGQIRTATDQLDRRRTEFAWFDQNGELLAENIHHLRDKISALRKRVADRNSNEGQESDEEVSGLENAKGSQVQQFMELLAELRKTAGLNPRGDVRDDWDAIDNLTVPGMGLRSEGDVRTVFEPAARRVLQYAVQAVSAKAGGDSSRVSELLGELAVLAGMQLVDPSVGGVYDKRLHDLMGSRPAGGRPRGTIAEVASRGLVRADGSVLKAKVYLYD